MYRTLDEAKGEYELTSCVYQPIWPNVVMIPSFFYSQSIKCFEKRDIFVSFHLYSFCINGEHSQIEYPENIS